MRQNYALFLLLFLCGCATLGLFEYDQHYGASNIENRLPIQALTAKQNHHLIKLLNRLLKIGA